MSRSLLHDTEIKILSPKDIEHSLKLCAEATQVRGWYAHGPERDPWSTVRGPYGRWFNVDEVSGNHVASSRDDANFAADAMNNYRDALLMILNLQSKIEDYEEVNIPTDQEFPRD